MSFYKMIQIRIKFQLSKPGRRETQTYLVPLLFFNDVVGDYSSKKAILSPRSFSCNFFKHTHGCRGARRVPLRLTEWWLTTTTTVRRALRRGRRRRAPGSCGVCLP